MAGTFETIHPAKVEIPTVTDSSYLSAMAGPVHSSTPTSALAPSMLMSSPLPVDVSSSVDGSSFGSPYGDFSDIAFDRSMQRPNQAAVHTPVRSDVDVIITPPTVRNISTFAATDQNMCILSCGSNLSGSLHRV